MSFAAIWRDFKGIRNKSDRERQKYTSDIHICRRNQKYTKLLLITKKGETHGHREGTSGYQQ